MSQPAAYPPASLGQTEAAGFDIAKLPADFVPPPIPSETRLAADDLIGGLKRWELWRVLAWQDIRQRYRRSMLGPLWITLSMGVMIGAMGPLYSALFHVPLADYLPYLSLGLLIWGLVSTLVTDGCICLTSAEALIKQVRVPLSIHVFRTLTRNIMIFGHNIVVYIVVALIFRIWPGATGLLVIPGFILLALNATWIMLLLGMLCARFRDIGMLIGSLLQVVFFLSPIFWRPEALGNRVILAEINPVFHFMQLIRSPLLGQAPSTSNWLVAIGLLIVGWGFTFAFFARFRRRLAYWL
ncbi:MAG TPA: ABC transporter permease [Stellaceae bacterium]|nr:ABC transporter permease [Stellaceae bacterium]